MNNKIWTAVISGQLQSKRTDCRILRPHHQHTSSLDCLVWHCITVLRIMLSYLPKLQMYSDRDVSFEDRIVIVVSTAYVLIGLMLLLMEFVFEGTFWCEFLII